MIKITIERMQPSANINPQILYDQLYFRNTNKCVGEDRIVIADMVEPIWWNRPLHSVELSKQEADGIWSYNLPFINNVAEYKTGYNLLLNKHSIPIATQFRLENRDEQKVKEMTIKAIYRALLALGVPEETLTLVNNDVLYNGKKFVGGEHAVRNGVFTENLVLTLRYKPEEAIFQRLTGQYALKRGITGIIEETELFTKEELLEELKKQLQNIIDNELV